MPGAAGAPVAKLGRVSGPGAPCKRAAWGEQEGGGTAPGWGGRRGGRGPPGDAAPFGHPQPRSAPWVAASCRGRAGPALGELPPGKGCSPRGAGSAGSSCPPPPSPLPRGTPAPGSPPPPGMGQVQSSAVPAAPSPAAHGAPHPRCSRTPAPCPRQAPGSCVGPGGGRARAAPCSPTRTPPYPPIPTHTHAAPRGPVGSCCQRHGCTRRLPASKPAALGCVPGPSRPPSSHPTGLPGDTGTHVPPRPPCAAATAVCEPRHEPPPTPQVLTPLGPYSAPRLCQVPVWGGC